MRQNIFYEMVIAIVKERLLMNERARKTVSLAYNGNNVYEIIDGRYVLAMNLNDNHYEMQILGHYRLVPLFFY